MIYARSLRVRPVVVPVCAAPRRNRDRPRAERRGDRRNNFLLVLLLLFSPVKKTHRRPRRTGRAHADRTRVFDEPGRGVVGTRYNIMRF